MGEPVSALADDLDQKFDELCSLHDFPELHLSEYFYELRNRIDVDAEKKLAQLESGQHTRWAPTQAETTAGVNALRSTFIGILNKMEDELKRQVPCDRTADQVYSALRQRINEFRSSVADDGGSIRKLEDAYISLADEIADKSSQLEAKLFRNQTVVYLNPKQSLGQLFYVEYGHLNKTEMEALNALVVRSCQLKSPTDLGKYYMREIHEAIETARNNSMKVHSLKPFVVTRSMLIISFMNRSGLTCEKKLIYLGKPPESMEGGGKALRLNQIFNYQGSLTGNWGGMDIDGLEESDHIFEGLKCQRLDLFANRLARLTPQLLALFEKSQRLNISYNHLEHLDEDSIQSCANLQALNMLKSCSPDTKFSLKCFAPLTRLTEVKITLPEGPADFQVFQNLIFLQTLVLEGVSSIDATKKRTKLNELSFDHLSNLSYLRTLNLSYFELPVVDPYKGAGTLKPLALSLTACAISSIKEESFDRYRLESLSLRENQLTSLEPGLFGSQPLLLSLDIGMNSLTSLAPRSFKNIERLQWLNLQHNQIEQLPTLVFRQLTNLLSLDLSHNSIGAVKRDVFGKLENLLDLFLNHNPITTIEDDSISSLGSLWGLSLQSCLLKSVSNRMFMGLTNLRSLDLSDNQISSFEIVNKSETIRLDKANLSSLELGPVKDKLFKDMENLVRLLLNGNRLEKLDLNVFSNLGELAELELANNRINELNSHCLERNLAALKILQLQSNQLTAISKNAFSPAVNLEELDLSNNKLDTLDTDFFIPFGKLKIVNLENNNLTFNINGSTFSQGGRRLEKLLLASNKLVKVEDGALQMMQSLASLSMDLSESFVISTEQQPQPVDEEQPELSDKKSTLDLPGLKKLRFLTLQKSSLETLKVFLTNQFNLRSFKDTLESLSLVNSSLVTLDGLDLGTHFTGLQELGLSDNQLKELNASWFEGLVNLRKLDVSKNCLKQLDDVNLFNRLPDLTSINLSHNKLTHINRRLFSGLFSKLTSIDLSHNPQLSIIDPALFRGLMNLREIRLSGNNIENLDLDDLLQLCPSLKELDLADNLLDHRSINSISMRRGTHLTQLNLARNRLDSMAFVFNLAHLTKLDLSGNKISSLIEDGVNTLGRQMRLRELDLSGNQIELFEEEVILHLRPMLVRLDLSQNPFDCKEPDILKEIKWIPLSHD